MSYFSKNKVLMKYHIISQFTGEEQLLEYLPDKLNRSKVTCVFLLALIFNMKKEKYLPLYNLYKNQKINQILWKNIWNKCQKNFCKYFKKFCYNIKVTYIYI